MSAGCCCQLMYLLVPWSGQLGCGVIKRMNCLSTTCTGFHVFKGEKKLAYMRPWHHNIKCLDGSGDVPLQLGGIVFS